MATANLKRKSSQIFLTQAAPTSRPVVNSLCSRLVHWNVRCTCYSASLCTSARQLCFRMLETPNWLVVIYSSHQIAEPRDPQYKDALPQEGLAYMVVALFAPPLEVQLEAEAWIRWVTPFYALTITFRKYRKPNCAHLASV